MSRRISAILSLDVFGHSAAMRGGGPGTVATLREVFSQTVRPAIYRHEGHVFKLMGDGALAEFPSAAAIMAAYHIQTEMKAQPVQLRAGVHVGDVIEGAGEILGDAINIAARLQSEARPGNAPISRAAADLAGGGLGWSSVRKG
jgi:class 3 adenylate cyclase